MALARAAKEPIDESARKRKGLALPQVLQIVVGRDRFELSTNRLKVYCSTD
jgi:hypothetical protein